MDSNLALSSLVFFALSYPFIQTCFSGSLNDPKKRLNGLLMAMLGLAIGLIIKLVSSGMEAFSITLSFVCSAMIQMCRWGLISIPFWAPDGMRDLSRFEKHTNRWRNSIILIETMDLIRKLYLKTFKVLMM